MATKEELARDVNIVTTFSSKYNLKNPAQVEKLVSFLTEKKPFTTQVGIWYIERLNQIKSGTADSTCFLCKRNESHDGILCDACMSKYTNGKKSFYEKKDATPTTQSAGGSIKTEDTNKVEQSKTTTDMLTEKISDVSGKVQSRLQEDDVQKAKAEITAKMNAAGEKAKQFAKDNDLEGKAEVVKEKAKGAGGNIKNWWKARKKWQKIFIASCVGLIILGAAFSGGDEEKSTVNNGTGVTQTASDPSSALDEKSFLQAYEKTLIAEASAASSTDLDYNVSYEFWNESEGFRRYKLYFLDEFVGVIQFGSAADALAVSINTADKDQLSALLWIAEMKTLCPSVSSKDADSFIGSIYGKDGEAYGDYFFSFDYNSTSKSYFLMALTKK